MNETDPGHNSRIWSEIRQDYMTKFEQSLYLERAGLAPDEAFRWWERYIFSKEAADALAAGRSLEQELEHAFQRRQEQRKELKRFLQAEGEREQSRREREQAERDAKREKEQAKRDQIAASTDFLDGLSPTTAALVRSITSIEFEGSDFVPPLTVNAREGRMICKSYEIDDDSIATGEILEWDESFLSLLDLIVDRYSHRPLELVGLDWSQAHSLLTADEVWPTTRRFFEDRDEGDPFVLNDAEYFCVGDSLRAVGSIAFIETRPTIVWADAGYDSCVHLGLTSDFQMLANAAARTNRALAASTWAELVDVLGRDELADFIFQEWEEWSADHDVDGDQPDGWPPDDWFPDHLPDLTGDWLTGRPRYNDPGQLDLPEEFMTLGVRNWGLMGQDFIEWDYSDLPKLARLADRLGYNFVERQDLLVEF